MIKACAYVFEGSLIGKTQVSKICDAGSSPVLPVLVGGVQFPMCGGGPRMRPIPSLDRVHKNQFPPSSVRTFSESIDFHLSAFGQVQGSLQQFLFNFRKMISKLLNFLKSINLQLQLYVGSQLVFPFFQDLASPLWKVLLVYIIISYPLEILGYLMRLLVVVYYFYGLGSTFNQIHTLWKS